MLSTFLAPRSFNETSSWPYLFIARLSHSRNLRNSISNSRIFRSLREIESRNFCSRSKKRCIALMAFSCSPSIFFKFCSEFSACFCILHNLSINCFLDSSCRFNSLSLSSSSWNSNSLISILFYCVKYKYKYNNRRFTNFSQLANLSAIIAYCLQGRDEICRSIFRFWIDIGITIFHYISNTRYLLPHKRW